MAAKGRRFDDTGLTWFYPNCDDQGEPMPGDNDCICSLCMQVISDYEQPQIIWNKSFIAFLRMHPFCYKKRLRIVKRRKKHHENRNILQSKHH